MRVAELIEKLRRYDPDAPVSVRLTAGEPEDVYTDEAVHVYRGRHDGPVIVDGGK